MRNKRNIYCDYQFWEAFFDLEEQVSHDRSRRSLWDSFYDFLSNNNIIFNISRQNVNEGSTGGKNLYDISRKNGGAGIKFVDESFPKLDTMSNVNDKILNSVFLTMLENSECDDLSRNYGVIVFNLSMIFSAKHVYVDNGKTFSRYNRQNWNYLIKLNQNFPSLNYCNSLVITDRYLLYDIHEETIIKNLTRLFEALLPQNLCKEIIFTICINAEYNEEACSNMDDKLQKLNSLIKNVRPGLNYKLNIFNVKLHDRSILTNNIILTSGAGFDIIGKDDIPLRFTTTSLYFPFLYSKIDSSFYLDWINNILFKEKKCLSYGVNYWGDEDKKNHLLDYYDTPAIKPFKHNFPFQKITNGNQIGVSTIPKPVVGIFCKGNMGNNDFIEQSQKDLLFRQEVRSIRNGVSLKDGDEVEYTLCREPHPYKENKWHYYAEDVHLKE